LALTRRRIQATGTLVSAAQQRQQQLRGYSHGQEAFEIVAAVEVNSHSYSSAEDGAKLVATN